MTIGNRVIYLLKQKKLKQKDLAEYLGTKPSTVNGWNQENKNPSSNLIIPICKFLDVPIAYLLTGDESYLTDTEINQKFLTAFSQLNTDNQDIIIGEIKKLLKEQRQEMAQQQTNQNNN